MIRPDLGDTELDCSGRSGGNVLAALSRGLMLAVAVIGLLVGAASAQSLSDAEHTELQQRKEALFQQMLNNPGNLDTAFAYADVSAKLGDNEAAVSALERMLLFNPNLPRVQLELGALYFRMGSFELARTYFEKAAAGNPPPEVKSRIETYLAEIARQSGVHRFTGFILFGTQYQSDANIAPGSPLIHSPVGDVLLNSQFVKKHDVNVFGTGAFLYSYDLGTQTRDTFEVGGTGFANHYSSVTRLDLGLAEATAGPRFNFPHPQPWVDYATLKPYAIANDVSLGGNQYFDTLGAGGEATARILDTHLKSIFEFRDKNFTNAPDRPLSRGLNGTDKLVSFFASRAITTTPVLSELSIEFDYLDQETRLGFYANNSYAGAVAYRVHYDDPTEILHLPWETTFLIGRSYAHYATPDPCCNTSNNPLLFFTPSRRYDRHWRFGITQNIQIADSVSLIVQLQRDVVSSNLPLYAYTSNSLLVGPQFRF